METCLWVCYPPKLGLGRVILVCFSSFWFPLWILAISICLSKRRNFILKWSQAWQCLCDSSSWLKLMSASVSPRAQRGRCVQASNHPKGTAPLQVLFLSHPSSFQVFFFLLLLSLILGTFLPPGLLWVTRTLAVSPHRKVTSLGNLCSANVSAWCSWSRWGVGVSAYCLKDRATPRTLCSAYALLKSHQRANPSIQKFEWDGTTLKRTPAG